MSGATPADHRIRPLTLEPNALVPGKRTSSSLHNGTRAMFERAGFAFERHIGKRKTVMRVTVPATNGGAS